MAPLALEIIHDPDGAEVDVVAAHGLGADGDWSWTWKDPKVPTTQVRWLSDSNMLPAVIPKARILVYNYDSKWHSDAPRITLQICGERFIQSLHEFRKGPSKRPIVFLGHSLGSIVIQHGLLHADSDDDLRYLTRLTAGLVTLGSPLRGVRKNLRLSLLLKLLSFRGSWGGIIDELTYENHFLLEKLDRFLRLSKTRQFNIYCFFELYETKFGKNFFLGGKFGAPLKAMIVPETSACISGFTRCGLQADHFRINKFSGPEDDSFIRVSAQLQQMCNISSVENVQSSTPLPGTLVAEPRRPCRLIRKQTEVNKCPKTLFLSSPAEHLSPSMWLEGSRAEGSCGRTKEIVPMHDWNSDNRGSSCNFSERQPIGKRREYQKEDDGSDNDDGGRREDKIKPSSNITEERQLFACPYLKYAPEIFMKKRVGCGPGWYDLHRLKEHVARYHKLPGFSCPRCCELFANEELLDIHLWADEPCSKKQCSLRNFADGFDKTQEMLLKNRVNATSQEKWIRWYCILFDKDSHAPGLPSPYQDLRQEVTNGVHGVLQLHFNKSSLNSRF